MTVTAEEASEVSDLSASFATDCGRTREAQAATQHFMYPSDQVQKIRKNVMTKRSDELPGFDGIVCRGARSMLGMSQQGLCDSAGCGRKLLNDFENGLVKPKVSKRSDIKGALERAGAVFAWVNDMAMVGVRTGAASPRTARSRAFADEGAGQD